MSTNSENETSAEKRQDNGRPQFLRSRLMGGNVLQGYAEFVPGPTPMTLGEEWVLCRAPAFDDLLEALKAMLARYVSLAGSGDCGFWDPETENEVIAARSAIQRAEGQGT